MKKYFIIAAFALFLGVFGQAQDVLADYYQANINHVCQNGYYWDQLECKSIYQSCLQIDGAVWLGNSTCKCDYGYNQIYFGYLVPNVHNSYFQFACGRIPPSPTPVPEPVTYCELNKSYSFISSLNQKACTCPSNSTKVRPSYLTGTDSFTCVAQYLPPIIKPEPVTYCDIGREYSFGVTPYIKQCVCPTGSYMSEAYSHMVGVHRFTCIANYVPPTPVCDYNQYWNGYSCSYYYQPYTPIYQPYYPVIQPIMYDDWQSNQSFDWVDYLNNSIVY